MPSTARIILPAALTGFGAGSSGNPSNARFDPEGVRVSNDGKSVFISDEYGPYVYQFDRATGQRIKAFELPANLDVATPGPTTVSEGSPLIRPDG